MALNRVSRIDGAVAVRNVLMSVSDKTGAGELALALIAVNPELRIFSTGGTYNRIEDTLGALAEKHLVSVSSYTGQPEMQGGLVKTLDFKIYLGLLSETYNPEHAADLKRAGAVPFDMVVVNLYPFRETVARHGIAVEDARTNIDIGGPCMIRAAAKNFLRVASVTDPADYGRITAELRRSGGALSLATRFDLARKAFTHTAEYDAAIAGYLARQSLDEVARCYTVEA